MRRFHLNHISTAFLVSSQLSDRLRFWTLLTVATVAGALMCLVTVPSALLPVTAHAAGAIVYSISPGQPCFAALAYNDTNKLEAIGEAVRGCTQVGRQCAVAIEFANTCAAIAFPPNCAWTAAARSTLEQAIEAAKSKCDAQGRGPCTIQQSQCDTTGETPPEQIAANEQQRSELYFANEGNQRRINELQNKVSALEYNARQTTADSDRQASLSAQHKSEYERLSREHEAAILQLKSFEDRGFGDLAALYAANTWRHIREFSVQSWDSAVDISSRSWEATRSGAVASWLYVRDLPTSTHIAMGVAAFSMLVATAALAIAIRRTSPEAKPPRKRKRRRSLLYRLRWRWISLLRTVRRYKPPTPQAQTAALAAANSSSAGQTPNLPAVIPTAPQQPTAPDTVDTPAALRAMGLACAYLAEITDQTSFAEEDDARTARTTLALAAKQLDLAYNADPNAKIEDGDLRVSQAEIRGNILLREAQSWYPHNQSKSIRIIERAKVADPNNAEIWSWSGWFNFQQRNRSAAIADFQRVLELDPDNIDALKFLDRTKNMGGAEVAVFKVANARDNTIIGVEKTFRVMRIPFLIITFPFRVIYFLGRAMYVAWTDPWRAARGDF